MSNNHHAVAHAWAHQTGKARKGYNVFYDGATIYSHGYHFAIARLLDVKGVASVLYTTREYSVSTSQHKSLVRSAISHLPMYFVHDVTRAPSRDDWETHLENASIYAAKSKRARKEWSINHSLGMAEQSLKYANDLNSAFDLGLPAVTLETLGVHLANREQRLAEARAQAEARRIQAEKERFERQAEARAAWLNCEPNSYYHGTNPDGTALLRVRGENLETSQGATVPLVHAIKAFRFIKRVRETGQQWQRNGHTIRVGHFQVDSIAANGDFKAGCHSINWNEVERVAKAIGVFDETASTEALESTHQHA